MTTTSEAHAIRTAHIKHEASVKSIGLLYYLAALLSLIGAVGVFAGGELAVGARWAVGLLLLGLSFCYFKLGGWFRTLNPKGRTPGTILACVGLLGVPVGTLVSVYILYLIQSKKGATVFSADYKAVIEATPEIKYKTSKIIVGLLIILGFFISLAIVGVFLGK